MARASMKRLDDSSAPFSIRRPVIVRRGDLIGYAAPGTKATMTRYRWALLKLLLHGKPRKSFMLLSSRAASAHERLHEQLRDGVSA